MAQDGAKVGADPQDKGLVSLGHQEFLGQEVQDERTLPLGYQVQPQVLDKNPAS